MQNAEELYRCLPVTKPAKRFNAAIAMNKPWSEKLHDVAEECNAACKTAAGEEAGPDHRTGEDINRRMSIRGSESRRAKKEDG